MAKNPYYQGPPSAHFDGSRFFNPGHDTDRRLSDLLRWRFTAQRAVWPGAAATRQVVPPRRSDNLRITMVGHATVLIQAAGHNYLVDPVWSDRASPVAWAGPARASAPGIALPDLPPIDTVLITHNHYDHLDIPTLAAIWASHRPGIIAPLGNDAVIARRAPAMHVQTADWHDTIGLANGHSITLHPAHHWSSRTGLDRRMALWCGFVIETPAATVYVVGDTGYGDGDIFRSLATPHRPVDVAIIPIGAYEPRWFMQPQHVNPEEAVQIMRDCGAAKALGVHWGCFQLTDEPRDEPKQKLHAELARRAMPASAFIALEPGDVWPAAPPPP
jgi:L-ascorbate metabolism protein UlaG (beta-lactamase superfamily)